MVNIYTVPKIVPSMLDGLEVVSWEVIPPYQHNSPIRDDLSSVSCILSNGSKRYFGTTKAVIGSDLRLHLLVNPKDAIRMSWEDSDESFIR